MDILFINPTEEMHLREEVNGVMLLATKLLQSGYDARVLRFGQVKDYLKDYPKFVSNMVDMILERAPKCVSFYALWPDFHIMLRIAYQLKQRAPHIYTVLGGPQASATADATMASQQQIDYICAGEGENTVVPFFSALLGGDMEALAAVPGVYWRQDGQVCANREENPLCDLDTLPHWDDRLYLEHYDHTERVWKSEQYFMPIDAGRGCPYNCTFCCTSHFWKRTYRLKSPDRILEDIRYFRDKFGIRSFWFSHDAFTTNRKLVSQVCDRILESGLDITWKCTARIDCITEELVLKMKQAGLRHIELGVETGSLRMQKLTNKNLDLQRVKDMVKFLLDNGLHVGLFFMYGFPEETEQDLNDTLELLFTMRDMGVHHISTSFCRFNPKTAITEQYFDQLVLDTDQKLLFRGIFGFQEEKQTIADNKAMFPFFYHLPTMVREQYHYTAYVVYLYQKFPKTASYLRSLFGGDNLRFYRAFYENNPQIFTSVRCLVRTLKEQPLPVVERLLQDQPADAAKRVLSLMTFEWDLMQLQQAKEDVCTKKTYDFSYLDLQRKKPLEQFVNVKTELLLRKADGKVSINILRFIEE